MARTPIGTPNWGDDLNADLDAIEATATAAEAAALVAQDSAANSAADAAASAADAALITGLTGEDAAVALLIGDTGSDTYAALEAGAFGGGGSSEPGFTYFDSYSWMGANNDYVTSGGTTATTTTGVVSAGASVIPVTSATGLVVGLPLIVNKGTVNQQIVSIASIASLNVTINETLTGGLASGAAVSPLWHSDGWHLTTPGYDAMAYWISRHPQLPNLAGKKISLLGNSWFAGRSEWATRINEMYPSATVVNEGVGGNRSTALLARFDTDVDSDSDYVLINEPGVNDMIDSGFDLDARRSLSNIAQMAAKARAIGATLLVTGPVPFKDYPNKAVLLQTRVTAASRGDWSAATSDTGTADTNTMVGFRAHLVVPTGSGNTGVGYQAQSAATTGAGNTGVGHLAQSALSTGSNNTAVGQQALMTSTNGAGNTAVGRNSLRLLTSGQDNTAVGVSALDKITTTLSNTAVGENAMQAATASADCVAIGSRAGYSLTTGTLNTMVGRQAGYAPNGVTANATTTAHRQTLVGYNTGQNSTSQVNEITCVGYTARASVAKGTAIGTNTVVDHAASVALGSDVTTTADNQLCLAARHIEIVEMTAPAAPATNAARLFVEDNGSGKTRLMVRFATGATVQLGIEP